MMMMRRRPQSLERLALLLVQHLGLLGGHGALAAACQPLALPLAGCTSTPVPAAASSGAVVVAAAVGGGAEGLLHGAVAPRTPGRSRPALSGTFTSKAGASTMQWCGAVAAEAAAVVVAQLQQRQLQLQLQPPGRRRAEGT
jgi:hypothetical protein